MRLNVMTIAGAALALSACGAKTEEGNVAADAGMTAEAITANDVTAIDAVTLRPATVGLLADPLCPAHRSTDPEPVRLSSRPKPHGGGDRLRAAADHEERSG